AAGTLRLVGTDPDRIFAEGARLLQDEVAYRQMAAAENPYGDGRAAGRIVDALEHILMKKNPPHPFGPGYSREAVALASGLGAEGGAAFEMLESLLGNVAPSAEEVEAEAEEPAYLVEG